MSTIGRCRTAVDVWQWVTALTVKVSTDDITFTDVDGGATFTGNSDQQTEVTNHFSGPVQARYVRIVVGGWHGHVSMRAGVPATRADNANVTRRLCATTARV